jgi:lysozyme
VTDVAKLEASVRSHEGYRAFPYKDTRGLYTVGVGRCLETNPFTGAEWRQLLENGWGAFSVSVDGADWLLRQQLAVIEGELAHDYADFWPALGNARQNGLIEMAYQLGPAKEEAFHNMIAAIRKADWHAAYAQAMDSQWARQTPARAKEIATMIETGEFP